MTQPAFETVGTPAYFRASEGSFANNLQEPIKIEKTIHVEQTEASKRRHENDVRRAEAIEQAGDVAMKTLQAERLYKQNVASKQEDLTPTERMIALERDYEHHLEQLQEVHCDARDKVEEIRSGRDFKVTRYAIDYVGKYSHSEIKTLHVNGLNHLNSLAVAGELPPKGYKVGRVHPSGTGSSSGMYVLIPDTYNTLADLVNTDESKAHGEMMYQRELDAADRERKQALVAIAEYEKTCSDEYDEIIELQKKLKKSLGKK